MNIDIKKLSKSKGYITYEKGCRIVYYYYNYHEAKNGLYAERIEDFTNFLNNNFKYTDISSLLNRCCYIQY